MFHWRALDLADAPKQLPPLLVKAEFGKTSYTIHLTDLCHIWKEELGSSDIVKRAAKEESSIEVSQHDPAQLQILLEKLQQSLTPSRDSSCRITRRSEDTVVLHTITALPQPLEALKWKFNLKRCDGLALKDELILPLLVHSQVQYHRLQSLITAVREKDRVISRLLDQCESSNLDLANAFPVIGASKSARRPIKREQAAKHVPGLGTFDEKKWEEETGRLDSGLSTPSIFFEEALPQHHLEVSSSLRQGEGEEAWWTLIPEALGEPLVQAKAKSKVVPENTETSEEDETTEDEGFEDDETLMERNALKSKKAQSPPSLSPADTSGYGEIQEPPTESESTEDEDDLDAPPRSQSWSQSQPKQRQPQSATPAEPVSIAPSPKAAVSMRPKGFRIGGAKARGVSQEPASTVRHLRGSVTDEETGASGGQGSGERVSLSTAAKSKKAFKIGGKRKDAPKDGVASPRAPSPRKSVSAVREATAGDHSQDGQDEPEEPAEETLEEKAERRRRELKRKNEEFARKQAHKKPKKRF